MDDGEAYARWVKWQAKESAKRAAKERAHEEAKESAEANVRAREQAARDYGVSSDPIHRATEGLAMPPDPYALDARDLVSVPADPSAQPPSPPLSPDATGQGPMSVKPTDIGPDPRPIPDFPPSPAERGVPGVEEAPESSDPVVARPEPVVPVSARIADPVPEPIREGSARIDEAAERFSAPGMAMDEQISRSVTPTPGDHDDTLGPPVEDPHPTEFDDLDPGE